MLENASLWDVTRACHQILGKARIPHAIVGGVAVCLHGYQRNTVDLDLLVRPVDADAIRGLFEHAGYTWNGKQTEFETPAGIPVQCLYAEDRAGRNSEVYFPDPGDQKNVTIVERLPVLSLPKLIECKLACGEGSVRRTHKDFADVVELIVKHQLSRSFARNLHKSVRNTFRTLVLQARGE